MIDLNLSTSPSQQKIFDLLLDGPKDLNTLVKKSGLSRKSVYNAIFRLREKRVNIGLNSEDNCYYMEVDMELDKAIEKEKKERLNKVMHSETKKALQKLAFYDLIAEILEDHIKHIDFGNIDKPPKIKNGKYGTQAIGALFSDLHIGRKTETYDFEIAKKFFNTHIDRIIDITEIEQNKYGITSLNIMALGDFVDGESIFPGHAFTIDKPVVEQALEFGMIFAEKLAYLSQLYPEINVYSVYGNHGRNSKFNAKETNWDYVLYKTAQVALKDASNIYFHFPYIKSKFLTAQIENHGFLMMHGDVIRMHYQIPYYGISNQSLKWAQSIPDWEYLVMGHFHHYNLGQKIVNKEVIMNGAYLTGDDYSLENIGVNTEPTQVLFGVHKKRGVTWRYPIYLD